MPASITVPHDEDGAAHRPHGTALDVQLAPSAPPSSRRPHDKKRTKKENDDDNDDDDGGDGGRASRASLPRIRFPEVPSRAGAATTHADASSTTEEADGHQARGGGRPRVIGDIVTPLPTETGTGQEHETSHRLRGGSPQDGRMLLGRMLGNLSLPETCRWVAFLITLFYIITVVAWPSPFVSVLGMLCGITGYGAGRPPASLTKMLAVVCFFWLNLLMLFAIWWSMLEIFVFDTPTTSSNYITSAAFVFMGTFLHVRSTRVALELLRKCGLAHLILFDGCACLCPKRRSMNHNGNGSGNDSDSGAITRSSESEANWQSMTAEDTDVGGEDHTAVDVAWLPLVDEDEEDGARGHRPRSRCSSPTRAAAAAAASNSTTTTSSSGPLMV